MVEYIDKSALAAEIKRRMQEHHSGYLVCLKDILSLINTIEVKRVDLDKEIDEHWDEWAKEDGFHFIDFAKHFYELGLKTQKEGLI